MYHVTETHQRRATVSSNGSVSLISTSAVSVQPEASIPAQLETTAAPGPVSAATPAPADPLIPHDNSSPSSLLIAASFEKMVELTKATIRFLQGEFYDINFEAQELLCRSARQDSKFLNRFKNYIVNLPVTKKEVHIQFFINNHKEILKAKRIQKLFIILGQHCNYTNYEIILHIVKMFCKELTQRMLSYRDSLIVFEKTTPVNVYLCAVSAPPGGRIFTGFLEITMKINKLASECTLHEIQELKESIEKEAALESYAVYIDTPETGSVCVRLCILEEVGWMVGVVLTPDFRDKCLLSEVTVKKQTNFEMVEERKLQQFLMRNW